LQVNLTKGFFKNIGLQQALSITIKNCTISYIDVNAFEGLQQLTDVDLSDNNLILIHPDTFQGNNELQRLTLSGNPLQLTQLLQSDENYFLKSNSLLELDLSRCQLSFVNKMLLSQVPSLQYISLRSNDIKVIEDYIFENVPLLEEVDLSDNMLLSINDEIFEDIEELTTLNLKNNLIENIDELDLPGLKELDVSYNNIRLLKKTTFEGISDLSSLNISYNKITWISEETFKDLIELKHLDLSHNALMGPLPKFIFEENEFLETLSLGGNREMHILEGFSSELPKLYKLDISDCGLSAITNSSFDGMPNIAILNMSMNVLTVLNHSIMSKLHRLNVLDLSHNEITKVGTHTFMSNSHLKILNLSNNKIHHLSADIFDPTPNLSHLDVSNNELSHIWHLNDSTLLKEPKMLSQLEFLNFAGNRIRELHKNNFGYLVNLKAINIFNNPLECTPEFPAFIEWLYSSGIHPLTHIGISDKQETSLEKSKLQWDKLMMDVCKPHSDNIEIKTKTVTDEMNDAKPKPDLNIYHYTVIEDVNIDEHRLADIAASTDDDEEDQEITLYMWPMFLVIFCIVFLMLAIGNTLALLIYRNRHQASAASFKTAFVTPFKRTIVNLETTPRYHKLYEECSVPNNTPIVRNNLLGNLVHTQIKGDIIKATKNDEEV